MTRPPAGPTSVADPDRRFLLYPAVDVRHGRVVRLVRGDASLETVFAEDPRTAAMDLVARGATRLHVVDLDAALGDGTPGGAAAAVVEAVGTSAEVQVGGGLRDAASIEATIGGGAARAILGTAALTDEGLVRWAVDRHGADRIAAALDVRGSVAVGEGWTPSARELALDRAIAALLAAGVRRFIVTAIVRDGTLAGPDIALLRRVIEAGAPEVVASGGIRSLEDLVAVEDAGCVGAIVGRAIYDGRLDLAAALAWAARRPAADAFGDHRAR